MMGWGLTMVAMASLFLAVYLLKKNPNISLIIAAVVPFVCFYFLGSLGYETIFIVFASIIVIFMNFQNRETGES
ncbi:hypothetical protein [Virgibacillus siamensis]|uniref:hypothetical protein n=1 Tax=Virgibacillus siamensis TaxID=480071 RepID=UPI0009855716|nr:hypothetical protein [Virgibacillus siamensis]